MITYEDYMNDHKEDAQFICNETSPHAARKERRRRRCFERASRLENINLNQYKTREEAEEALKAQGEEMVVASGGIVFVLLSSIISWIIQKLLSRHFG